MERRGQLTKRTRGLLGLGWFAAAGTAVAVRLWNALAGPSGYGYDAWGHYNYVFFLDLYRSLPYSDQSWSFFHPPLHYLLGWVLAQFGQADVLLRGLALVGSVDSLGVAVLSALLVHRTFPSRPKLALLAFTAVAFLPVHLYTSPMPGNELTAAFLASAAVVAAVLNEMRERPGLGRAALAGGLAGLAILAKTSAAVAAVAILAFLVVRRLREGALPGLVRRAVLIAGLVLVVAGPYYARNLAEFGTPIPLLHVDELVAMQPPGSRSWRHYLRFSPRIFTDARPGEPHLAESVWATFYLGAWSDLFGVSQQPRFSARDADKRQFVSTLLALSGVIPTALLVLGVLLSVRRVLRDPRAIADLAMLLLSGGMLLASVGFTWRVPVNSAVKASYLLVLSPACGLFLARGIEFLSRRGPRPAAWIATGAVIVAALLSAALFTSGLVLPRRVESYNVAPVRAYFGETERALAAQREFAGHWPRTRGGRVGHYEILAGIQLLAGNSEQAREYYDFAVSFASDPDGGLARNLAVATALAGDPARALEILERASGTGNRVDVLVNRGALRANSGRLEEAESDLRTALELDPGLAPAWTNLAALLGRSGRDQEAQRARDAAYRAAAGTARGYPFGIGSGHPYDAGRAQRWMLILLPEGLELYRPLRARNRLD